MYKRILVGIGIAGILIFSSAKLTQPAAALSISEPSKYRICSLIYRNLKPGTRGDDVRGLQEYLSTEGYLSVNATGYFGPMTAQAVAKWQTAQGVSAVGSFGPMSRERIKIWCGGGNIKRFNACPQIVYQTPVCALGETVAPVDPTSQCPGPWRCVPGGNKPPTISSLSGPTTLLVNAPGTWTINAGDPKAGNLTYSVTWGDEDRGMSMASSMMAREAFLQTTIFTHSYTNVGTYTVTIIVRDALGQEAKTSTTVNVSEKVVPNPCQPGSQSYPCPVIEDEGKIKASNTSEAKALADKYGWEHVDVSALGHKTLYEEGFVGRIHSNFTGEIGCIIFVRARGNEGYMFVQDKNLNVIYKETIKEFVEKTKHVDPELMSKFYLALH